MVEEEEAAANGVKERAGKRGDGEWGQCVRKP
jgi:hypothetical protein